ncbi:patatin-like phospholipase family protein [Planobispora longispora]|uniref:PNPLA domain-containing protein n=1 Tax=Planobispora longispora TaxID=28887 RepID=A0A8J3RQI7_9ACTN|nr:patatin-like phospholipase family protein [Planobispora longispora]GIH77829.1 hypothetical protein Plo01_42580 [Planobispora longispora]
MSGGLALVLSGGGAPAAYFGAGVIAHLEERGLLDRVNVVSGTSAGAFNAAAVAAGLPADRLAEMWTAVRPLQFAQPRLDVWRLINWRSVLRGPTTGLTDYLLNAIAWTWFVDTRPARQWLLSHIGRPGDPQGRIPVRAGTSLIVSAVSLSTGQVVRFTNRLPERAGASPRDTPYGRSYEYCETPLSIDHLFASAAVPLLFQPGRHDDVDHVDAGLVANTPLSPVFDYEPDGVIVVSASGVSAALSSPASLGSAIGRIADNLARYAVYSSYEHARTVNALVDQSPETALKEGRKHVDLLLIEPEGVEFTMTGFLDFSTRTAARFIEFGHAQAERALRGWPGGGRRPGASHGPAGGR